MPRIEIPHTYVFILVVFVFLPTSILLAPLGIFLGVITTLLAPAVYCGHDSLGWDQGNVTNWHIGCREGWNDSLDGEMGDHMVYSRREVAR